MNDRGFNKYMACYQVSAYITDELRKTATFNREMED